MTARRVVAGLLCLVASMQALTTAAIAAETPKPAAGYWWIAQPDTGGVPAPSSVPPGGLYVASAATGATAVSAVRFVLPLGVAATRVTLKVASSQQVEAVAVDAYPATKTWKPGDAQAWSQRPAYDTRATPVHGALQSNGTTLIFNLPPSQGAGVLDLVLVPAAGSTVPPTFDLALEPPANAELTTSSTASHLPPPSSTSSSAVVPQASPPAFALAPPLPALGSVGLVPNQPQVAAPQPAAVAPVSAAAAVPVAQRVVTGRSRRDLALLIFLLADVMFYLGWLSRGSRNSGGPSRLTIYDLPPATAD
ncbi:MAG: hypothetical protein JWO88_2683 [Frankiales bacterium]|nr:hypothetical protein [Frankiales bacterium]